MLYSNDNKKKVKNIFGKYKLKTNLITFAHIQGCDKLIKVFNSKCFCFSF